ncbi:MAG: endonuclease III domain-containing protein [Deltaproteobacteria bacterium]|nr:MAG: endonuclease III domain-containing protein [Deltaproteobacteria bacterium]
MTTTTPSSAEYAAPSTRTGKRLMEMFHLMLEHFGPRDWWPADTPLEVMVGAVLTQNTNWQNVEKAILRMKAAGLLSLDALRSVPAEALAREIRPSGYYNIKAGRLKNLVDFLWREYGGDLPRFLEDETGRMREGLLSIKGIGPETADSILLYAAGRPVFVVDAYTHRILSRHRMIGEEADYHELQALFMDHLPEDTGLYNEFHALIVQTGKEYCRRRPLCSSCPLEDWEAAD